MGSGEGGYRKLHDGEFHNFYFQSHIIYVDKAKKMYFERSMMVGVTTGLSWLIGEF
jgi:hypothetical protein